MKRILLTSTALVAFAGAAAAEVSYAGDAELKYNSETDFSYSVGLTITGAMELDNGVSASLSGDVDFEGDNSTFDNNELNVSDITFGLSSETASLTFGDTATAAESNWTSAGDMEQDGFAENGDGGEDAILRGDVTLGSVTASVSYGLVNNELSGAQMFVGGTFGNTSVGVAVEDGDNGQDETAGLFVSTTVGGADLTIAYATTGDEDSTGVAISYPVGAVTVGAHYVVESNGDDNYGVDVSYTAGAMTIAALYHSEQGNEDIAIDLDYDMGNGLTLKAGVGSGDGNDDEGYYVGAAYDLGGGASVALTHVEADNVDADNEYFGDDDNLGTTLTLNLAF